jgi:hypothetical protein
MSKFIRRLDRRSESNIEMLRAKHIIDLKLIEKIGWSGGVDDVIENAITKAYNAGYNDCKHNIKTTYLEENENRGNIFVRLRDLLEQNTKQGRVVRMVIALFSLLIMLGVPMWVSPRVDIHFLALLLPWFLFLIIALGVSCIVVSALVGIIKWLWKGKFF